MIYLLLPLYLIGVLGTSTMQPGAIEGGAVLSVACMSAYSGFRRDRRERLGGRTIWIRWGYGLPALGKSFGSLRLLLILFRKEKGIVSPLLEVPLSVETAPPQDASRP